MANRDIHNPKQWDVFISYASEDESSVAKPLADALTNFGLKVWFAPFVLQVGDSLSRTIDKGLAESEYGIIVVSTAFLNKSWPEYELRGLIAREIGCKKVILPVWHEVSREQVLQYSPPLADKLALDSSRGIVTMAVNLAKQIRPELFQRIHRRIAHKLALRRGRREMVDPDELNATGAPVHGRVPAELVGRIRLVRAALLPVYPHSLAFWLDGFRRDSHISHEVQWWERVAGCFLEAISLRSMTSDEQASCFSAIFSLANGNEPDSISTLLTHLEPEERKAVIRSVHSTIPPFDIDDMNESFLAKNAHLSETPNPHWDKEHFPLDIPDIVIDELIREHEIRIRNGNFDKTRSRPSSRTSAT